MLKKVIYSLVFILIFLGGVNIVLAADPVGGDWFQILTNHTTGANNTGDGGNYYYVGQTFTGNIQIRSDSGTSASNIWIDYDPTEVSASGLTTGSFFPNWSGQTISGGRIKSTGYRTSGYSTGLGSFGSANFTALKPTDSSYGTSSPAVLDINIGTIGNTGESNISRSGLDLLSDAKDFRFYIWADTVKPYAKSGIPSGILDIGNNISFTLCDSKGGETSDGGTCLASGVGTGVNTSTPPGYIKINDGSGEQDFTSYSSYNCSGTWGTNNCDVSISPTSPVGISGDNRKWKYGTSYTLRVGGYRDKASSSQNQLGDANGPNTMDDKSWTFTTENDTVKPRVVSESPTRASSANSVSTNIVVDVLDKKDYSSNISGIGLSSGSCKINISSSSQALSTYQQGGSGLTVLPIDFGYRFTINPANDFAQNETVSVSVYDCQDLAGNTMITDNYTFSTADSAAPYVDQKVPADDGYTSPSGNIGFHIKDDGVGVDLANTIIYINGVYYTNGSGAGVVTNSGTKIAFSTSLNFHGGNYSGDTTSVSGSANDWTFTINPQNDFIDEESVPVIIYSRDSSDNIMPADIYAFGIGNPPIDGSAYCGSNTTWDGTYCVGSGGSGYCPSGPSYSASSGSPNLVVGPEINESTISIVQVDETSVLLTWFSNVKASAWVVYDTASPTDVGSAPNYSYAHYTPESKDDSLYHSVIINSLKSGTLYYFRPIIKAGDVYVRGTEVKMSPRFGSYSETCNNPVAEKIVYQDRIVYQNVSTPQICPVYQAPETTTPTNPGQQPNQEQQPAKTIIGLSIDKVRADANGVDISGSFEPNQKVKITLYLVKDNVPVVLEVVSGADGHWSTRIERALDVGSYVVVAEDDSGKYKIPVVFYLPAPPTIINQVTEKATTEPITFYSELIVSIMFLGSLGNLLLVFLR